ncbi:trophoblast glycoprotein-like [Carassius gibelio]|uniref:trophoblast glycoprotein-like n=1 Tax=Carassius gibelio TaxID=101364 RepID=UPI0022777F21|nr:trophoblast glycoprotein-like [Carassius gibelio]
MRYDGLVSCERLILPLEVPRSIQNLTLYRYNISVLTKRAFSVNETDTDLRALSLQDNNIQVIENCAFCGLPRLLSLDLSHNRLMVVHPGAFYGLEQLRYLNLSNSLMTSDASQLPLALSTDNLGNLQRLDLSGNRLEVIPLSGFGNLNLTTLILTNNSIATLDSHNLTKLNEFKEIRIYLSQNPFECKCDKLKEFYNWLKNSSQCADSNSLKCAQPEKRKNTHVMDLEKRDMECQNLDARSYVLLGIVLALIGVVFLMVLYLNRRGIKRWLNNIREACRDQMEVYHYRYEQDSDPRLANVAV